jgi:hypothetical protein
MKNFFAILMIGAALSFTACGGKKGGEEKKADSTAVKPAETPAPAPAAADTTKKQ